MPYNIHKKNLIREAQTNNNLITIFYEKANGDRVRRVVEPYEVRIEERKDGLKEFLYAVDDTPATDSSHKTIKRFNVEKLGLIIVLRHRTFFPKYEMKIVT